MPPGIFYQTSQICPKPTKPLAPNGFPFDRLMTPTFQASPVERRCKPLQRVGKSRQRKEKSFAVDDYLTTVFKKAVTGPKGRSPKYAPVAQC